MRAPATTTEPGFVAPDYPERRGGHWEAHPLAATALRLAIFLVPIAASVLVSWMVARRWPRPPGLGPAMLWWLALVVVSGAAMVIVDRIARRFLPLSTLLRMSLVFPDEKPSRFGVALRTGTTHQLEERLDDIREHGLTGTEREAAEQLLGLVAALRLHDRFTRGHGERVRAYSALIGEELGLDADDLSMLQWAGLIHDVGKLAVPEQILNKPGELTPEEWDIVRTHPAEGMALVGPLAPWLGEWVLAVGEHHERWDGTGYPNRLAGTEISRAGRIVAVADVFDVITAARSYKPPLSAHAAREELAAHAGSQFDPEVVRAFLNVSIGRLRTVMWPLSWFANIPFLGSTVTAPATSWVAPAVVAVSGVVGGTGLAEEPTPPAVAPVVTVVGSEESVAAAFDEVLEAATPQVVAAPAAPTAQIAAATTTTAAAPSDVPASDPAPVRTPIPGDTIVAAPLPTTTEPLVVTPPPPTDPITGTTVPTIATLPPPVTQPAATTVPVPTTMPATPTTAVASSDPCEQLRQGATELSGLDLTGCDISGLDLTGVDLTGVDLTEADLTGVRISGARLDGADLTNAEVEGLVVTDSSMVGVLAVDLDWSNVRLDGVDLTGAQLTDADFADATLRNVRFDGANLTDAALHGMALPSVSFVGTTLVDADLEESLLRGESLSGADLTGADLSNTNLRDADLNGAVLRDAILDDTNLRGTDLTGADFTRAQGRPNTDAFTVFSDTICPNGVPATLSCWP